MVSKALCFLGFHSRIKAHAKIGNGPLFTLTLCKHCGKKEWSVLPDHVRLSK